MAFHVVIDILEIRLLYLLSRSYNSQCIAFLSFCVVCGRVSGHKVFLFCYMQVHFKPNVYLFLGGL